MSQDCDMATLHQYLSCLPTEIDTEVWETIIERASHLINRRPPETLESLSSEWKIKW